MRMNEVFSCGTGILDIKSEAEYFQPNPKVGGHRNSYQMQRTQSITFEENQINLSSQWSFHSLQDFCLFLSVVIILMPLYICQDL